MSESLLITVKPSVVADSDSLFLDVEYLVEDRATRRFIASVGIRIAVENDDRLTLSSLKSLALERAAEVIAEINRSSPGPSSELP